MYESNDQRLLSALHDLLEPHLQRSSSLREAARVFGQWLLEACETADEADGEAPAEDLPSAKPASTDPTRTESKSAPEEGAGAPRAERDDEKASEPPTPPDATVLLKIGDEPALQVPVTGNEEEIARVMASFPDQETTDSNASRASLGSEADREPELDLALIEARCRLKAEGCRVFIARRAAMNNPAREQEEIRRIEDRIARAQQMRDCFLWMFWRERRQPDDDKLRLIASCYDALAATASVLERAESCDLASLRESMVDAMQLMAEASSALRIALEHSWLTDPDVDQEESHWWLRRQSSARGIYLPRFMRLDDPADPGAAQDLVQRAEELEAHIDACIRRDKQIAEEFKRIQYHARRIEQDGGDVHDYQRVSESIDQLMTTGIPPSDPRFGDVLNATVIDTFPDLDGNGPPHHTVFKAILQRRHAAEKAMAEARTPDDEESSSWSERVLQARALLTGGAIVVVGGESRNDAVERMTDAFALTDVFWPTLSEHGPAEPIRAPIYRPETKLVVVLVKLAGHHHVEEAVRFARDAEKACVLLPAGYNPEQIAEAVFGQASNQLGEQVTAEK